jgi:hypothetical protein
MAAAAAACLEGWRWAMASLRVLLLHLPPLLQQQ